MNKYFCYGEFHKARTSKEMQDNNPDFVLNGLQGIKFIERVATVTETKAEINRIEGIHEAFELANNGYELETYICPSTGLLMDLQGNVVDDQDQNELLHG